MNYIRPIPHVNGPLAEMKQTTSRQAALALTAGAPSVLQGRDSPLPAAEKPASADSGVTLSERIVNLLNESDASDSGPFDGQALRGTTDQAADDSPSGLLRTLGAARNLVAGTVTEGLHVAADALVGGIDVVGNGLQLAVRDIEGVMEKSTSELTARAEAALGYAALAAMAGAAALNELA
jgi:hypothetical protein